MKRFLLSVIAVCTMTASSFAQGNSDRMAISMGVMYPNSVDATLSWEHESKYHNAVEFFINGNLKWKECESCGHVCPDSFWKNYRTWGIGAAYKPCVWRGRNNYSNLRIGASAGSNTDKFIGGFHVGYEQNYALRHGWTIYWQAKCDLIIPNREDLFRTGLTIGVKFPHFN